MNPLTIDLIKLAFLAVLWLFVIAAVGVVRTDIFDQPTSTRRQRRRGSRQQSRRAQSTGPIKPARTGRAADATLVLTDDYASTRHARLFPQNGEWVVEDLGSTNGTYLDRQKVTKPTPVPLGTPVRIGKTVLELRR